MKSKNKPLEKEQHDGCKKQISVDRSELFLHGKTVRLTGRDVDLQYLSTLPLRVGDARVYEYEKDGTYYLKDPRFDVIPEEEVGSNAEGILKVFNDYAESQRTSFQPVEIGAVCTFEEGVRKKQHFFPPVGSSSAEMGSGKSSQDAQDALAKKIFDLSIIVATELFIAAAIISIIIIYSQNILVAIGAVIGAIIVVVLTRKRLR